ncbi:transcription elongation factor GreA [Candidatus Gracilibacteria bacterium]|nr:transcription elongation factor GreA [bacterium]NDK19609.1 transcription elongation factor GreA [Candidatus Gracilibacteria bacterium]OIO77979.1 MAG: transcription elongation factor GreA [Candidatus Gracilibacteria bacterium CG1_02_38_174]PIQ11476.1 MAG: transcription elongation factor GreA [Candidatus Gracilibacteria bacterium CG18_big_fil_WC_8_21_14_2_50_38_16]PIQ41774.1 MAG: transcription elongation factor GreA [Candidatus Gracilibacteria bacterium CG12_big_fil_rev_8_21_14_0_65_38_15]PIZ
MAKVTLLTKEGLNEFQVELQNLKEVRRVEVAAKLKEAISYGDLSENSEYEDARSEQAQIEIRIAELEEIMKNHEIIDTKKTNKKQTGVNVGSLVTITSVDDGKKETFRIVGSTESDIFENKLSNESPIGKSLIGKNLGDIVKGQAGYGSFEYKIVEIK